MSNKYLVVIEEDEYNISSFVSAVLQANGFDTMVARNGAEAIILITSHCPDLVLLDLGLPDMDGQGIIENVRGWPNEPIIVVSARTRERDKVKALESGADDYITKPFSPSEMVARVKAHLSRYERLIGSGTPVNDIIEIRGLKIDKTARRVYVNGEEKNFTTKEFDLLAFLAQNPNHVFTKEELFSKIWDMESIGDIATVTVHI